MNKKKKTDFEETNAITERFKKSAFVVIASKPSKGKTALALSMVQNLCINTKMPCAFFSLELPKTIIIQRLINIETKILKSSNLTDLTEKILKFINDGYKFLRIRTDKRKSSHFGEYKFYTAIMQRGFLNE